MRRSYLFGLVFLATALLAGCSLAPAPKTAATSPSGQLSVTPGTVAFGSVAVGNSSSKKGSLTAAGAAVTVSTVDASGEGYSLSGITFPVTVPAGQSVPFTVIFAPQTAGSAPGSLSFVSDASDTASAKLTGTGTAPASSHTVSLSWSAGPSSVVGYNVYRGSASGGPYSRKLTSTPVSDTSFVDATVQSSATYYYVATAVDSDSVESSYSDQAQAVIP
jgi:Abnormal spindle-like microcephaly-assoc'd, ASPM-SPD-2-Hydin